MTTLGKPVRLEVKDGIALVTIDNPPVNATSQAVRAGLLEAISQVQGDRDVEAAVVVAEGRTFVAGGSQILAEIRAISEKSGPGCEPAPLLIEMASRGTRFSDWRVA